MDKITKGWVHHLRKTARQETASRCSCPLCDAEIPPDIDSFRAHVRADSLRHCDLADDADIEQAFKNITLPGPRPYSQPTTRAAEPAGPGRRYRTRDAADGPSGPDRPAPPEEPALHGSKKLCSPRPRASDNFDRSYSPKNPTRRQFWSPDNPPPWTPQSEASDLASAAHPRRPIQPETKPISQDQLVAEVKGIYAGLVMIESKCIEYDSSQETSQEQYHAHNASVLLEHHDFFLAIEANADTGASFNVISEELAMSMKLSPEPDTQGFIPLPSGKQVYSPGRVNARFKFLGEDTMHQLCCVILPNAAHSLVLGAKFLRMTETLTKYTHRLRMVFSRPNRLSLKLLGGELVSARLFERHGKPRRSGQAPTSQ